MSPTPTVASTEVPPENSSRMPRTRRPGPGSGTLNRTVESAKGRAKLTRIHWSRGSPRPPTSQDVDWSPSNALGGRNWGSGSRADPYPDASIPLTPRYTATLWVDGRPPNSPKPVGEVSLAGRV